MSESNDLDRGGIAEAGRGPAQQALSPGEKAPGIGEQDNPAEAFFTEWKGCKLSGATGWFASILLLPGSRMKRGGIEFPDIKGAQYLSIAHLIREHAGEQKEP